MQLQLDVAEQTLRLVSKQNIVADSLNYLTCKFTFSSEWDGIPKTAVFISPTDAIYTVILENDECEVPWEVIQSPSFQISVYGGDRITANLITVNVSPSGYMEGDVSQEPTPDVYTQILNKLDKVDRAYEYIYTCTVGEDGVTSFTFDKDINGNTFKLNGLKVFISGLDVPTTTSMWRLDANKQVSDNVVFYKSPNGDGNKFKVSTERISAGDWYTEQWQKFSNSHYNNFLQSGYAVPGVDYITKLFLKLPDAPAGTTVTFYGRRVAE